MRVVLGMAKNEKREYAYLLFTSVKGITLQEIAERCQVSKNTITRWKQDDNWEELATAIRTTSMENLRRLHGQLQQLNESIEKREEGLRYPSKAEADTQIQLSRSIKNLEKDLTLSTIIDVFEQFLEFAVKVDPSATKQIVNIQNAWIQSMME